MDKTAGSPVPSSTLAACLPAPLGPSGSRFSGSESLPDCTAESTPLASPWPVLSDGLAAVSALQPCTLALHLCKR